jgi:hypothetical protein
MAVAVDPGKRPGAVALDGATGRVLRIAATVAPSRAPWIYAGLTGQGWDIAATELQWFFGDQAQPRRVGPGGRVRRRKVNVNDLLKLAFRAGFGLACIPAERSLAILPQDWRAALGYGAALTKEQVQKKIADNLTAPERVLFQEVPAGKHGDVLDAIGIGRAAIVLAATTNTHDWTLECRK